MKKILLICLLAVTLIFGVCLTGVEASASAPTADKYAVVIGIGSMYGENLGADNDAKLMAQILKRHGFQSRNIKLLTNRKATVVNVNNAIEWLKTSENSGSTVVFFFSGHGGTNFIQLWNGLLTSIMLGDKLAELESRKVFLAFQACYSGSLINELEGDGRIVVSSALEDTISADGGHYSLWGYWFLDQGMKREKADENGDGVVSIEEAKRFVNLGMISDNYEGELVL